jgi:hypothetical protein
MMSLPSDAAPVSAPLALAKRHYNQVGGVSVCCCFLVAAWFLSVCGEREFGVSALCAVC